MTKKQDMVEVKSCAIEMGAVNENRPRKKWVIKNLLLRWFLAEFFGTFLLIFMSCSINMQYLLFKKETSTDATIWGSGLTVTLCVYATFGISGGHINPAVTMAFYTMGRMDIRSLLVYWAGQYAGSFLGAALTYLVYYEAFYLFDHGAKVVVGESATAALWASYPHVTHHAYTSIIDQIVGTAILLIFVLGIVDSKNTQVSRSVQPLLIGLVVVTILTALSYNSGAAINPARDFGPRLFSAIAGWGVQVFTAYDYFFWIPIVCPHLGAILGAILYQVFIGWHEPPYEDEVEASEEKYMTYREEDMAKSDIGMSERVRLTTTSIKSKAAESMKSASMA